MAMPTRRRLQRLQGIHHAQTMPRCEFSAASRNLGLLCLREKAIECWAMLKGTETGHLEASARHSAGSIELEAHVLCPTWKQLLAWRQAAWFPPQTKRRCSAAPTRGEVTLQGLWPHWPRPSLLCPLTTRWSRVLDDAATHILLYIRFFGLVVLRNMTDKRHGFNQNPLPKQTRPRDLHPSTCLHALFLSRGSRAPR